MKKITKLSELKKMDKAQLLDEMMKGTIKGGSSCGIWQGPVLDEFTAPSEFNIADAL